MASFLLMLAICVMSATCRKIPLRDNFGTYKTNVAHWFENEGVAYVFFRLDELPERLVNPAWEIEWSARTADGGIEEHKFDFIDFSSGIHLHEVKQCERAAFCGSFSFASPRPIVTAKVRFRYDRHAELSNAVELAVNNHEAASVSLGFSARFFGTFSQDNQRLQVRYVNNFGDPIDGEIDDYGMTRKFRISDAVLQDHTMTEYREATQSAGSAPAFPATFCTSATGTAAAIISNRETWLSDTFPSTNPQNGTCYKVEFLDKNEKVLGTANGQAYALRNPVLQNPNHILKTPLRESLQIPIVIRICENEPSVGEMFYEEFFNYQRTIMGIRERDSDMCFRIGFEGDFETSFRNLTAERLAEAKTQNPERSDFVFSVLLHENFSGEFNKVQSAIASQLTTLVAAERDSISPRLVGAFVYAAGIRFKPTGAQTRHVLWCPKDLSKLSIQFPSELGSQSCTIRVPFEQKFGSITVYENLGPIPSWDLYEDYVTKHGTAGLAKEPELKFFSVPTGTNTRQEDDVQVTFFDTERYTIATGEFARVCPERLEFDALFFRVRMPDAPDESNSLTIFEVNNLWLSEEAAGSYRIGLSWTYPFVGRVDYKFSTNVSVTKEFIAYQDTDRAREYLADARWYEESFNFGSMVQHCFKYCDHPFFDDQSNYQINDSWNDGLLALCPTPAIPDPEDS
jgi:hypothetical protein